MVTDPLTEADSDHPNPSAVKDHAWTDTEVGDACEEKSDFPAQPYAFDNGQADAVLNGHYYFLPRLWSISANGCVLDVGSSADVTRLPGKSGYNSTGAPWTQEPKGTYGDRVSLGASGFTPNETVDIEYATGLGAPNQWVPLCQSGKVARADGTISCTDNIPDVSTGGVPGSHLITFTGRRSGVKQSITFALEGAQAPTSPAPALAPSASPAPTTSATSTAPATAQPSASSTSGLPSAYIGTWSGTMNQPNFNPEPYAMSLTLNAGNVGDEVGDVVYPTLPCRTTLVLKSVDKQSVTVDEQVVFGSCLNGTLTFQLSNNILSATFHTETGEQLATASLTRDQP